MVAATEDRMYAGRVLQLQLLVLILKRHQLVERGLCPLWLLQGTGSLLDNVIEAAVLVILMVRRW